MSAHLPGGAARPVRGVSPAPRTGARIAAAAIMASLCITAGLLHWRLLAVALLFITMTVTAWACEGA